MSLKHDPRHVKIMPGAIVCEEAKLRGDITIGSNTIIHPCAIINAEAGPVIIGDNCLIEEQAKIIHRVPFDRVDKDVTPVLIIGSNNCFEIDCTVEAAKIGDNNIFEAKSFVGNKVTVTDGCVIGAACSITEEQTIPKNTVIYGDRYIRREALEQPQPQYGQMETLKRLLPNYHHIRKPNKKPEQIKI